MKYKCMLHLSRTDFLTTLGWVIFWHTRNLDWPPQLLPHFPKQWFSANYCSQSKAGHERWLLKRTWIVETDDWIISISMMYASLSGKEKEDNTACRSCRPICNNHCLKQNEEHWPYLFGGLWLLFCIIFVSDSQH